MTGKLLDCADLLHHTNRLPNLDSCPNEWEMLLFGEYLLKSPSSIGGHGAASVPFSAALISSKGSDRRQSSEAEVFAVDAQEVLDTNRL